MKVPEFGTLQMVKANESHYGIGGITSLNDIKDKTGLLHTTEKEGKKTFQDIFLMQWKLLTISSLKLMACQKKS